MLLRSQSIKSGLVDRETLPSGETGQELSLKYGEAQRRSSPE
jgi:hypothetical protein